MKNIIILQAEARMTKEHMEEVQQILLKQKEEGLMIVPAGLHLVACTNKDCDIKIEQPKQYCGDCKYYTPNGLISYCSRKTHEGINSLTNLIGEDFEACRHFELKED